jgi:hypothetical protein
MKRIKTITITVVCSAAILAASACASGQSTEAPAVAAPKTVTVTPPAKTVTPKPKVITKTIDKTPAACLKALDAANSVILIAGQGFDITSDILTAASELDADGIKAATNNLDKLREDGLVPALEEYKNAREACVEVK